jgi:hypothetical protein
MVGQGGPLATGTHRAARQSAGPIHLSSNQIQPSSGIRLDHVRRGATGVPRSLHTLRRPVWWNADFQRPPWRARSQLLEGETNCHRNRGRRRRGRVHTPYRKCLQTLGKRDAATRWHTVHGGITVHAVRPSVGPMKATTIYAAHDVPLEDQPDPTIQKPTDAIVRVLAARVCGSDLWYYRAPDADGHARVFTVGQARRSRR